MIYRSIRTDKTIVRLQDYYNDYDDDYRLHIFNGGLQLSSLCVFDFVPTLFQHSLLLTELPCDTV